MTDLATKNQFGLFRSRKFLPLFLTQFLGGFNDNFFKSALVILITYRLADAAGMDARILVAVAAGIFILPFFLCSSLAGQLADKYERARLARMTKIAEIVVMSGAAVGFYLENIGLLMVILFLMGAQSAFFSPVKYSILPQHLEKDELIGANGLIEMGTFLSILTGTIFGGLFILRQGGAHLVNFLVIGIAVLGYWTSRYIPPTRPIDPALKLRWNAIRETAALIREVTPRRDIFLCVLGISWFWLVGATFLSQFPTYAKDVIHADEQVATLFLAAFSVGIGVGSVACDMFLKGEITGRYAPWAAFGMSGASALLYLTSGWAVSAANTETIGVLQFLRSFENLGVLACLFMISFFGGLYIVPLYAIIQSRTEESFLARVTACVNVMDSLFMVLSSVGTTILFSLGMPIPQIFLVMAVLTVIAAFVIRGAIQEESRGSSVP